MSKDKVLIVLILFICILHNLNELYKIEGIFVRATGFNLLMYNTIRHFCLLFRSIKKRGFDVFSLTVIFKTRYENHSNPPFQPPANTEVNKKARTGPDNTVEKLGNYSCFFGLWWRNLKGML